MKSGRIGAHENMYFSSYTITEQRARSLRLKLCRLLTMKRRTVFTAARGLLDLVKTLERLSYLHSEYIEEEG